MMLLNRSLLGCGATLAALLLAGACKSAPAPAQPPNAAPADPATAGNTATPPATSEPLPDYLARRTDDADVLHGVTVPDPYRWLEDGAQSEVRAWEALQSQRYHAAVDSLPQRAWLAQRLEHLMRYDDESPPLPCYKGTKIRYMTKKAEQDKWVLHMRDKPGAPGRVILDPNTWDKTETLGVMSLSDDCRYLAFGKARAGDENPIIRVLDIKTMQVLPDTLAGWRQGSVSWLPDNSGFYYSARPVKGEVPAGEEYYWHRVYFHKLGTTADKDKVVFEDKQAKELYHNASVSEDGRWLVLARNRFYENEVYLQDLRKNKPPVPVVTGFGNDYQVEVVNDKLVIMTNWNAPRRRIMITSVDKPGREHWKELVPEAADSVETMDLIGGHLYVSYQHDAATRIAVYTLAGKHLHDIALPAIGTMWLWGYWSKPEVWSGFTSFAHPTSMYRYDVKKNALSLYKKSPIDFDPSHIAVEQVWFESRDGTRVPMFLVHPKDAPADGSVPYLLTGYGGFDISINPYFSSTYGVWTEAGGGVAIVNLRGGGEFGKPWHEAGMRDKKQNVFDDFLAAAEWLIANRRTSRERLAIEGSSNGGLLVGAAVTQRPDLFRAVLCEVPLLDMVRYHRFGLANIWAEEYGNAEDPAMFRVLHAYSPYHRIVPGTDYPAVLVTGSDNDARVDPLHARKFAAALQWADRDHGTKQPIFVEIHRDSGHGGGVTIDTMVEQRSRTYAFLMSQLGMDAPTAQ